MFSKRSNLIVGVTLCSLFFISCASTPMSSFIPLDQVKNRKIGSTSALICLQQIDFCLSNQKSNIAMFTGGGLIPALMDIGNDSSHNEKERLKAHPIYETILERKFKDEYYRALSVTFNGIKWLPLEYCNQDCFSSKGMLEEAIISLDTINVMYLNTMYQFIPDANILVIKGHISLFPKDKIDKEALIYKNTYVVRIMLKNDSPNVERASQAWLKNDGELIKSSMEKGLLRLVELIKVSLEQPANRTQTSINITVAPNV